MDRLLRTLVSRSARRALSGHHWAWFVIAGSLYAVRILRNRETVHQKVKVRPGGRYRIKVEEVTNSVRVAR